MNEPPEEIKERLLYILHRGFVEVRLLCSSGRNTQAADLADALELIPGMIKNWHPEDISKIKTLLKTYQDKHTGWGFDFIAQLEDKDPPPF
jgi:hypothetical protein